MHTRRVQSSPFLFLPVELHLLLRTSFLSFSSHIWLSQTCAQFRAFYDEDFWRLLCTKASLGRPLKYARLNWREVASGLAHHLERCEGVGLCKRLQELDLRSISPLTEEPDFTHGKEISASNYASVEKWQLFTLSRDDFTPLISHPPAFCTMVGICKDPIVRFNFTYKRYGVMRVENDSGVTLLDAAECVCRFLRRPLDGNELFHYVQQVDGTRIDFDSPGALVKQRAHELQLVYRPTVQHLMGDHVFFEGFAKVERHNEPNMFTCFMGS
ncbi:hypothetical protein BT69DRAFT_1347143 [Atractiella rhizophila]|nr:hypothetical protein BT69DRAFT_1347143 [Atractiella rhizophila]